MVLFPLQTPSQAEGGHVQLRVQLSTWPGSPVAVLEVSLRFSCDLVTTSLALNWSCLRACKPSRGRNSGFPLTESGAPGDPCLASPSSLDQLLELLPAPGPLLLRPSCLDISQWLFQSWLREGLVSLSPPRRGPHGFPSSWSPQICCPHPVCL